MNNLPNNLLYRNIRGKSRDIIEKYLEDIPVDVEGMVKEFGVELQMKEMDDSISGILDMTKKKPIIICNSNHTETRQRFTIAHELGHFLLHGVSSLRIIEDSVTYYSTATSRQQEREANKFAADVLMPRAHINNLAAKMDGNPTIEFLAKELNVSEVAMSIRVGLPT